MASCYGARKTLSVSCASRTTHQQKHLANMLCPQAAACKPFRTRLNGYTANSCSNWLPKVSTANLRGCSSFKGVTQTTCRVAARDVEPVTAVPSSGPAEGHVGPAKGLRAIVIGTGMAGLAAARIMADSFDEVSRSMTGCRRAGASVLWWTRHCCMSTACIAAA